MLDWLEGIRVRSVFTCAGKISINCTESDTAGERRYRRDTTPGYTFLEDLQA